jgi:hypothetical protein
MSDCVVLNVALLNRARVRRGFLKGDLAVASKLHRKTVGRALSGRPVGIGAARKIAEALGVAVNKAIVDVSADGGEATEPAAWAS